MREPTVTERDLQELNGSETVLGLLRRLLHDLTQLFRQEAALATAELSRSLLKLAEGIGALLVAAVLIHAGVLVLLAAAVLGLMQVVPPWAAALIVGVVTVLIGAVVFLTQRSKLSGAALKPSRSVESLREDKAVLTRGMSTS